MRLLVCEGVGSVRLFCHVTESLLALAETRRIWQRSNSFCTVVGSDDGGGPGIGIFRGGSMTLLSYHHHQHSPK
jgi:hypothetical protein